MWTADWKWLETRMPETVTISKAELETFARCLLQAGGAAPSDAQLVADALVWADLRARHTQGVSRLPNFVRRLQRGLICSPASMTWKPLAAAAYHLDASNGFGHIAGHRAMTKAIELAKSEGVGLVAVSRSNLYGAAGYFCSLATEAHCIGFSCTNAVAKVAPFGGTRPVIGTNPLAFGCPTASGVPILIDLSTSAIAGSSAREAGNGGGLLPEGVALDARGNPTRDPSAAAAGCLLPAGPKGYALGLMVEILAGVLTGAAVGREVGSMYNTWDKPVNTGHIFLAIDIGRFYPLTDFLTRVDQLLEWIKSIPAKRDGEGVRVPGELRAQYAQAYSREGIPLPLHTASDLHKLAEELKVKSPWQMYSEKEN
jgi:ureidoglycolate dehydrogenase (NAD+)